MEKQIGPFQINAIYQIDSLRGLVQIPDHSLQCCITSPPYWRQRDYQVDGQYGMEKDPQTYIDILIDVFDQVRRILKPDGVLWLIMGDGYWSAGAGRKDATGYLKPKDLIGLPWRLAFGLQAKGWYLRQDCIWHKPNAMPESVKDRCTRGHEYIFMLTKSGKYYYDGEAIKTPLKASTLADKRLYDPSYKPGYVNRGYPGSPQHGSSMLKPSSTKQDGHGRRHEGFNHRWESIPAEQIATMKANRRSVWKISTKPFFGPHYASFPIELPLVCIAASTRPGDLVLDPFMGTGSTAIAAKKIGRDYLGFEINPGTVIIAQDRVASTK